MLAKPNKVSPPLLSAFREAIGYDYRTPSGGPKLRFTGGLDQFPYIGSENPLDGPKIAFMAQIQTVINGTPFRVLPTANKVVIGDFVGSYHFI